MKHLPYKQDAGPAAPGVLPLSNENPHTPWKALEGNTRPVQYPAGPLPGTIAGGAL